ncbi:hypothetical protein BDR26DRAFT_944697 [Obelidium mucronatum]|nr:hypothetical protein BDR26DRAFT_944697 [Obelidium mucronatum]
MFPAEVFQMILQHIPLTLAGGQTLHQLQKSCRGLRSAIQDMLFVLKHCQHQPFPTCLIDQTGAGSTYPTFPFTYRMVLAGKVLCHARGSDIALDWDVVAMCIIAGPIPDEKKETLSQCGPLFPRWINPWFTFFLKQGNYQAMWPAALPLTHLSKLAAVNHSHSSPILHLLFQTQGSDFSNTFDDVVISAAVWSANRAALEYWTSATSHIFYPDPSARLHNILIQTVGKSLYVKTAMFEYIGRRKKENVLCEYLDVLQDYVSHGCLHDDTLVKAIIKVFQCLRLKQVKAFDEECAKVPFKHLKWVAEGGRESKGEVDWWGNFSKAYEASYTKAWCPIFVAAVTHFRRMQPDHNARLDKNTDGICSVIDIHWNFTEPEGAALLHSVFGPIVLSPFIDWGMILSYKEDYLRLSFQELLEVKGASYYVYKIIRKSMDIFSKDFILLLLRSVCEEGIEKSNWRLEPYHGGYTRLNAAIQILSDCDERFYHLSDCLSDSD